MNNDHLICFELFILASGTDEVFPGKCFNGVF